jgi:hypothetical protein
LAFKIASAASSTLTSKSYLGSEHSKNYAFEFAEKRLQSGGKSIIRLLFSLFRLPGWPVLTNAEDASKVYLKEEGVLQLKQRPMVTACRHPKVRIVSRHEDTEFVECLECGEVFDSEEFRDMEIEDSAETEDVSDDA